MGWRELLALPFVVMACAVFLGVGVLAWKVGGTWDQRNTDMLITGLITVCMGGTMLTGGIVALIVGMPFALRIMRERRETEMLDARMPSAWGNPRQMPIDAPFRVLPDDARPLLPGPGAQPPTQYGNPYGAGFGMGMMGAVPFDGLDDDSMFGME